MWLKFSKQFAKKYYIMETILYTNTWSDGGFTIQCTKQSNDEL